jgi:hypothetical protein
LSFRRAASKGHQESANSHACQWLTQTPWGKASLDSESFSTCTELCGCIGDELYVLPEYRDRMMSVHSTCSQAGDCMECCKLVDHSFGVPDCGRSFQDSRVCISVALLPKLVMLPGRDASLSEDDADRAAFLIFWSLFRCSQDATLIAGMCVCVSLSLSHCCDNWASCPSHRSLVGFSLVRFSQCRFS